MSDPLILVTGFGPFEDVEDNPSGRIAERLDAEAPPEVDVAVRILPVSFRGAVSELDAALAALEPRKPDAILSLGVHKKGTGFRLERRAGTNLDSTRKDILGVDSGSLKLPADDVRETTLDLDALMAAMQQPLLPEVEVSEDAGGYVCERLYHHALERAAGLGVPAVFLHVPPTEAVTLETQLRSVRQVVAAIAKQVAGERRTG